MPGPRSDDATALTTPGLAVTRHLLVHGPASRGHLGRALQMSEASVSRVTRRLVDIGLITETTRPTGGMGRPEQTLAANPGARRVVGIKLTDDTAYAVTSDLFGTVTGTAERALPEPVDGVVPVKRTVTVLAGLVRALERDGQRVDSIGVSLGGVVQHRTVVQEGTFLGWRDVDLAALVDRATDRPTVVANDVIALAHEQLWFGAGRTHPTFGVVTVGAGLGFALVREGIVPEQLIDNGHLLSHSPVDTAGPACSLGHRGCAAAYLNAGDIAARQTRTAGSGVDARGVAADDAARALGHLVATFAGALQTDRIVLAGEDIDAVAASPALRATIDDRLRPGPHETQRCTLDISTAPLGFTDWARGAAVVAVQHVLGAI